MNKWANYIKGNYAGPVVQINNSTELKTLQNLAKKNKLIYYEYFCKSSYKEILNNLELNYDRLHKQGNFYRSTRNGRSFLVEYSNKGFCFTCLNDYDALRKDPEDWEIIPMSEIMKELFEEEDKSKIN